MSDNHLLSTPRNNVIALLLAGFVSWYVLAFSPALENAGMGVLIVRWVPMMIALFILLIYLVVYRFRPAKAHLVTVGGLMGLVIFLVRAWM